ncbi:MAG: hypothetical protein HY281_09725 [Nitrospirae bacterium]|nr:hypothetical protein [Nitrospirota bacterium]
MFFLALLCVISAACSTTAQTGKILFDDPRGTVSLQSIPDRSIQATHPINLEPVLLAEVLKGIEIQTHEVGIQSLLSGRSASVPVFSEDQILFLAPLLAEGLRTATPNEHIEYRVQTTFEGSMFESSATETTAGSLYAYGRQLFVTLSQYRYSPTRAHINVRNINYQSVGLDSSGLKNRILLFTPSAAQRSDSFDPPPVGKPTDRFLAIDYQLLQQAPPATATAGQTAPRMERTSTMRESPLGTSTSEAPAQSTEALAQEVKTLKKELQSIQKQLGSQPTGQNSPKQKTTPPLGPQKPAP